MELEQMHRQFAKDCYNGTWALMEKANRTPEETHKMIAMTYASLYHWSEIGTALNLARGHWQISRVWAIIGEGQNALKHGMVCLNLCELNDLPVFDLAYAHEALARAAAIMGDEHALAYHLSESSQLAEQVTNVQEREYLFNDLKTISG